MAPKKMNLSDDDYAALDEWLAEHDTWPPEEIYPCDESNER